MVAYINMMPYMNMMRAILGSQRLFLVVTHNLLEKLRPNLKIFSGRSPKKSSFDVALRIAFPHVALHFRAIVRIHFSSCLAVVPTHL